MAATWERHNQIENCYWPHLLRTAWKFQVLPQQKKSGLRSEAAPARGGAPINGPGLIKTGHEGKGNRSAVTCRLAACPNLLERAVR